MKRLESAGVPLSLLLLGWTAEHNHVSIAIVVCLCRFLKIRTLRSLLLVTVAYYFVAPPFAGVVLSQSPSLGHILLTRFGAQFLDDLVIKALTLLVRLLLATLIFLLLRSLSPGRRTIGAHLALLGLMATCSAVGGASPAVASFSMELLLAFGWAFFTLCYLLLEVPRENSAGFVSLYLLPFWETAWIPRPVLDIVAEPENQSRLARRCIRLAVGGSLLIVAGKFLNALLYGKHAYGWTLLPASMQPLPDLETTGLTTSLFLVYSRWSVLLSIVWSSLHRITNYFSLFLFIECAYLALGFDVPRRFTVPIRANSFAEFYNGLMPYYVILINHLYFYPFYSYLRKRRWNRYRAYDLALCFAIVSGGLVSHIVRDIHLVALLGAAEYLWRYLLYGTPYFFLIFLSVRLVRIPHFLCRILPAPLKFTILLTIYALIFLTRMDGIFLTWHERLQFCSALFLGGIR